MYCVILIDAFETERYTKIHSTTFRPIEILHKKINKFSEIVSAL